MSFARAIAFILRPENDGQPYHVTPGDAGGPTAYGIALRYHPELTDADLRAMTMTRAAQIIEAQYFQPIKGYQLPDCIQLPMLDTAVVEGVSEAIRCLQAALFVTVDGVLGPQTLQAANLANPRTMIRRFTAERIVHLSRKPNWPTDGGGWSARAVAAAMEAQ